MCVSVDKEVQCRADYAEGADKGTAGRVVRCSNIIDATHTAECLRCIVMFCIMDCLFEMERAGAEFWNHYYRSWDWVHHDSIKRIINKIRVSSMKLCRFDRGSKLSKTRGYSL